MAASVTGGLRGPFTSHPLAQTSALGQTAPVIPLFTGQDGYLVPHTALQANLRKNAAFPAYQEVEPMDKRGDGMCDNMVYVKQGSSPRISVQRAPVIPLSTDQGGYLIPFSQAVSQQDERGSHAYQQINTLRGGTGLTGSSIPLYFADFFDFERELHTLVTAMRPSQRFSILCCVESAYARETHIISRLISLTAVRFSAQIIDENNQDNNTEAFKTSMDEIVNYTLPHFEREDTTSVDMNKLSKWVERAFITYVENRISSMRGSMCFPDSARLTQFLLDNKTFKTIIERGTNQMYKESLRNVIAFAAVRFAGMKIEEALVRKKTLKMISEIQSQNVKDELTFADWKDVSADLIKALMSYKNRTAQNVTVC